MSDEAFHLTPIDIRRYDFGTALRGYDKARVDQFRDQVAAEVDRLLRLNQELDTKSKGLVEQLTSLLGIASIHGGPAPLDFRRDRRTATPLLAVPGRGDLARCDQHIRDSNQKPKRDRERQARSEASG